MRRKIIVFTFIIIVIGAFLVSLYSKNDKVVYTYKSFQESTGTSMNNITKVFMKSGMTGNSIVINDKNKIDEFINLFNNVNYSKSLNQEMSSGYGYFADFYVGEDKVFTLTFSRGKLIHINEVIYNIDKEISINMIDRMFNSSPLTK